MSTTRSHGKDEVKRYFYYTTDTLVDSGADVNARDEAGDTPLHYAAYFGELAVIRLLVERGADVSALNSYGRTPRSWGRFKTRAVEEYLLLHWQSTPGAFFYGASSIPGFCAVNIQAGN